MRDRLAAIVVGESALPKPAHQLRCKFRAPIVRNSGAIWHRSSGCFDSQNQRSGNQNAFQPKTEREKNRQGVLRGHDPGQDRWRRRDSDTHPFGHLRRTSGSDREGVAARQLCTHARGAGSDDQRRGVGERDPSQSQIDGSEGLKIGEPHDVVPRHASARSLFGSSPDLLAPVTSRRVALGPLLPITSSLRREGTQVNDCCAEINPVQQNVAYGSVVPLRRHWKPPLAGCHCHAGIVHRPNRLDRQVPRYSSLTSKCLTAATLPYASLESCASPSTIRCVDTWLTLEPLRGRRTYAKPLISLVGRVGIEPTTKGL